MQDGFTARDIKRKRWTGLSSGDYVEFALDILEELDWIQGYETAGTGGGRPTVCYLINPHILATKSGNKSR